MTAKRYHVAIYRSGYADSPEEALRLALEAIKHSTFEIEEDDESGEVILDGMVEDHLTAEPVAQLDHPSLPRDPRETRAPRPLRGLL